MKKFIYGFICITFIVMVSCKQAAGVDGGNKGMNDNSPFSLEKKTQAQEKEYKNGSWWTVSMKGDIYDPRPDEEKLMGPPDDYDIINTVLYTKNAVSQTELAFFPSFEIQKTVKYKSGEISFVLTIEITTSKLNIANHYTILPAQLQLSNNQILNYNCQVSYKETTPNVPTVTCKTDITLDNVNLLRLQQEDVIVTIKTSDKEFTFTLPLKFIEFLREI